MELVELTAPGGRFTVQQGLGTPPLLWVDVEHGEHAVRAELDRGEARILRDVLTRWLRDTEPANLPRREPLAGS